MQLSHLPMGMLIVDLSGNELAGPLDLSHLPSSVEHLNLPGNNFCGNGTHNVPCANLWLPGDCSCTDFPNAFLCPSCA